MPDYIERGVAKVSARGRWNEAALSELALPTEIWRETVARRARYADVKARLASGEVGSIDDFVTYNLDLRQFTEDAVERSDSPDFIRTLYAGLKGLSILDPACGSGAFLFAALNVLEPVYESVLDRMSVFVSEADAVGRTEDYVDFRKILRAVSRHPDREYFIYKSIILDNLYGVDIMDEACEIAKLRLFLKLMSRIDTRLKLEPLPDIDFNIRAGNTLVGFARYEDAKKVVEGGLDFDDTMERIDRDAKSLGGAIADFRAKQEELGHETASESAKVELRRRRDELNETLNGYLAFVYGKDKNKIKEYEAWKESHKPFHWWVEFYTVLSEHGGFDVIIGNPPYVNIRKVNYDLNKLNYITIPAGDLYTLMMERSFRLGRSLGFISMIVPLSYSSTQKMVTMKDFLSKNCSLLWTSYYSASDQPASLFTGVRHRLSIFVACINNQGMRALYTTRFIKWFSEERTSLFNSFVYYVSIPKALTSLFPKISTEFELSILQKLLEYSTLKGCIGDNKSKVYFHNAPVHWGKAFNFVPDYRVENGPLQQSSHVKSLGFATKDISYFALCLLNSSHFYWYNWLFSNCRDLTITDVERLPLGLVNKSSVLLEYKDLGDRLMYHYKKNSKKYHRISQGRMTEFDSFYPMVSKSIIDEIDRALAKNYGLTEKELDYIINYDIKYRMGLVGGAEEEE